MDGRLGLDLQARAPVGGVRRVGGLHVASENGDHW
jgi:hypothetical protein